MNKIKPLSKFARNLKRLREARGLSQEALAKRAKIHQSTVARLESDAIEPGYSVLLAVCSGLDVFAEELIGQRKKTRKTS